MKPTRERFALTLEAKDSSAVPAIQRLKHVLKALGRAYGFRAVGVLEIPPRGAQTKVAATPGREPTP